jgi:YHS domain-containing protein
MIIDPVCKKELSQESEFASDYEGVRFFFCSEDCKKRFDHDPPLHLVTGEEAGIAL